MLQFHVLKKDLVLINGHHASNFEDVIGMLKDSTRSNQFKSKCIGSYHRTPVDISQ